MRAMQMQSKPAEVLPERDPSEVIPFRDMCLVRIKTFEDKTESGIHLLDEFQKRRTVVYGELVALGIGSSEEVRAIPIGSGVVLHGHSRASYKFSCRGQTYGIYVADDLMATEVAA